MKPFLLLFTLVLGIGESYAQREVFVKSGYAIQGYDPVAYFKQSKAVKGKKEFAFEWQDATWLFESQENVNDFKSNPEKYAPQFGGFCAYGMYQGHKAPTSPDAWTIVEDKLYLNYNVDVKKMWLVNRDEFILLATKNWPNIKKE